MSRRGWILFALMSVIWGVPYLMIKVAVDGVSVPVLVFARTAVGAAVLLPLALRGGRLRGSSGTGGRWPPSRRSRSWCRGGCCRMPSAISPAR
nr:hypothetical protein GCM10020093_001030 [Planobispora longispora]